MEHFSKWVGRRPGLENLSGLWSGQCVMRLAPWRQSQEGVAGRAIPWGSPRALWSRDSGQHLCWCPRLLAENFLKKPSGWKLLEKCSVTRPVPAIRPRPNLEDASSYPFVF